MTWVSTAVREEVNNLENSVKVNENDLAMTRALFVFFMKLR